MPDPLSSEQQLYQITTLTGANATTPIQITKTVAASGTPEALAASGTYFRKATILAQKAARSANTGTVYLGIGSTNDTQPIGLSPGDVWSIEAPQGEKYDLNDWYLDVATNGDGVVIIYAREVHHGFRKH